jgi:putative endonuclease
MIYDICMLKHTDLTSINQLVTRKERVSHRAPIKVLKANKTSVKPWFLYVIECADGSLYTGVAVDVHLRYAAHMTGGGARYTRSHPPRRLLVGVQYADRSAALKAD